jgi:hypothetical protein
MESSADLEARPPTPARQAETPTSAPAQPPMQEKWLTRAAILSIVASLLHGLVTGEHFDEWWGYGVFFVAAALAQGVFGLIPFFTRMMENESILQRWPASRLQAYFWAGIVGNVLIIGMYVVTRTVGIPFFGPEAGTIEAVGPIDVVSKLTEAALVAHLWVLSRRLSAPIRPAATTA